MLTIPQLNLFCQLLNYTYKEMGMGRDSIPTFIFLGPDCRLVERTADEIRETLERKTT